MEAAITHALTGATGDERLRALYRHLSLGGPNGKLAFAEALEILEPKHLRFLRRFTELRNRLVHDVQNVGFSLDAYVGSHTAGEVPNLARDLVFLIDQSDEAGRQQAHDALAKLPKLQVWSHAIAVVSRAYLLVENEATA